MIFKRRQALACQITNKFLRNDKLWLIVPYFFIAAKPLNNCGSISLFLRCQNTANFCLPILFQNKHQTKKFQAILSDKLTKNRQKTCIYQGKVIQ